MEEKKKNNGGLIVLIVILLIALLGAIGYICYEKGVFKTKKEESKQVVETKEVELTDETIKKDLTTKIEYITDGEFGSRGLYGVSSSYSFRYKNDIFGDAFNKMNDDLKLQIVLDYLFNNNKFEVIKAKNELEPNDYKITTEEVNKEYKNYFGKDITENKSIDVPCYGYTFDSSKNMYFTSERTCGGTTGLAYLYYINKYTEKDNQTFVYVSYGSRVIDDEIYYDLDATKLSDYKDEDFKINESNYKDFEEYKYTFEQDDSGNYYFVSLEKNEK